MSNYQRLGVPRSQSEEERQQQQQNPFHPPPYHDRYTPSPAQFTDDQYHGVVSPPPRTASPRYPPMRSPSPVQPQESYPLQTYEQQRPLDIPMGPGPPGRIQDRLQMQPTYSVENVHNSYGHNEAYVDQHPFRPNTYHPHQQQPQQQQQQQHFPNQGAGDYALDPEAHHDAYYTEPYQPTPSSEEYEYSSQEEPRYWQDEVDTRPMLQQDSAYGPDPHTTEPPPPLEPEYHADEDVNAGSEQPPPPAKQTGAIRRWKTVKEVQLYYGNLVLDCPVPPRLLNQIDHAPPPERDEYTHMRYSAATCDPADFFNDRFTLRQRLFAKPRHTELFICVTMYNESEELFARTMIGIIKNIEHMNSRTSSKTWGKEAWKKIVVCVVSDGRAKIHPRTRALIAAMGVYQEGIAKQQVNGKDVTAHIYEYTTQMKLEINKGIVQVKKGNTPIQMIFCLKEKNQKKINSHRWFFQAFGSVLNPNICVLIDAGTKPGKDSVYQLWKAFDLAPHCAGACGEIKTMLFQGRSLLNPLVASQNFEYKISNILDKPLESVFGFISVLPGAFSAYRYVALQNDATGHGPLEKYFHGEKMHGANAGVFTANMYLAEDRILCFELVAKRRCHWVLTYVKSAEAETDVPTDIADFIVQRRRWLNGSFFAAVYALAHFHQIFSSGHSFFRQILFLIEFSYQTVNMIFAWFAMGNFFLVFKILTASLGASDLLGLAGQILAIVFEWLYLVTLISCFFLALGNRPKGSRKLYLTMVYFWAFIMIYLMFAAVFITVISIRKQVEEHAFNVQMLFTNKLFFTLIVSMCSTYLLYFLMSLLFFDPWHMVTSFVQYLLLTPTYVNVLNVYAFCNTHDITWGTKGEDKPAKLPTAIVKPSGGIDVAIPTDDHDLNSQYESELAAFSKKYVEVPHEITPAEKQEDYYKGVRTSVVLVWVFCNLALAAVVLNAGGLESVKLSTDADVVEAQRSTIYMSVVLWSVAGLSAFRFVGSFWFLVIRLFRGV